MKARKGLTRIDLVVALACVFFVLANVPVIIAAGRGRAKLEVCMANLKTLTSAWKAYADDNDGNLVNAAPTGSYLTCPGSSKHTRAEAPFYPYGGHYKELPWIGPAWVGYDGSPTNIPLPETAQRCAIETGALWKYARDYRIYHCPVGFKGELITYIIIDSMNGLPMGSIDNSRGSVGSVWSNTAGKIKKSSMRLVFIDEGKISPDSYAVSYSIGGAWLPERWIDPPMVRHGDGTTVSFADGHAEHKKWRARETVDFARLAEVGGFYGTFPTAQTPELAFQDLYWMQIHCWGKLGYTPTYPPDID